MKHLLLTTIFAPMCLLFSVTGCSKRDSEVDTRFIYRGSYKGDRLNAMKILYDYYTTSDKSKKYYEVISRKGSFIANYNRVDRRLSFSFSPGSGWSVQFGDITEADLAFFASQGLSVERMYMDWDAAEKGESGIFRHDGKPLYPVPLSETNWPKTNGLP